MSLSYTMNPVRLSTRYPRSPHTLSTVHTHGCNPSIASAQLQRTLQLHFPGQPDQPSEDCLRRNRSVSPSRSVSLPSAHSFPIARHSSWHTPSRPSLTPRQPLLIRSLSLVHAHLRLLARSLPRTRALTDLDEALELALVLLHREEHRRRRQTLAQVTPCTPEARDMPSDPRQRREMQSSARSADRERRAQTRLLAERLEIALEVQHV
eukprot:2457421-Rhodomonas_salina.4